MDNLDRLLNYPYGQRRPLRVLVDLYHGEYRRLGLAIFWYIIKHSGAWAMPLLTANIINVVAEKQPLSRLWVYAAVLAVIFIQNVPTHYLFVLNLSTATRNIETALRAAIARRLQQLSIQYYHQQSTGKLQSKMLRDVEIIQQTTQLVFHGVPAAVVTLLFALTVTAIRTPVFLVFFLFTVPTSVILIQALRNVLKQRNRDFRQQVEGMSSRLIEMIHLIPVTRAHGLEEEELMRVEQSLDGVRSHGIRLDIMNAIFGATAWVTFRLFELACLVTAAYMVYNNYGGLTIGDVVMLTGFFTTLTNAVMQLTTILPDITRGFESIYSLGEILEAPDLEQNQGKTLVREVQGHFRFEQVAFAYADSSDNSLQPLDLEVFPGETLAIVGPSGAGKSTLLNLVIGFLRPTAGCIWLDGRNMQSLDLRSYRRFLAFVPQDTILFEGTVRENITYGLTPVSEPRLRQAIRDANAEEFIENLPEGLETRIGENGARLSGGQRQRLAIARALIRDPRVLVLDEATSALDTTSEAQIQEALARLMQNRTTFVVAHRLSTIQNATRILVLEHGQIIEMGTHQDLLHRHGTYAQLYN